MTSEERVLLAETVADLLADRCPPDAVDAAVESGWTPKVWEALRQAELTLLPLPEERGGGGAGLEEAAVVLRAAGRFAAPVPLAETALLAGWLLAEAGLDLPTGPLAAAAPTGLTLRHGDSAWRLSGCIARVPYARVAERLVLLVQEQGRPLVLSVDPAAGIIEPGRNVAGEPRDDVVLDGVAVPYDATGRPDESVSRDAFTRRGALGRALLMAGAADRALELTVRYASERVQFGRPIARFQAVQQHLAEMASETAAIGVAAEAAARALQDNEPTADLRVAAAKLQAGRSGSVVARLAHQVHGAIGFTYEHVLRHSTTRLWAWRDEFGTEEHWARALGRSALAAGADGLWPLLTSADSTGSN